jgi:hypothetical protein
MRLYRQAMDLSSVQFSIKSYIQLDLYQTPFTALLIVYGASTSTTLLPCIYHLLSPLTPSPAHFSPKNPFTLSSLLNSTPSRQGELSNLQLAVLLSSYIPFFLLPFGMTIDMSRRVGKVLRAQERAVEEVKRR